jgi:hypothetical protein
MKPVIVSDAPSKLLSVDVKRINNPCKVCLVKPVCVIPKSREIIEFFSEVDAKIHKVNSHDLAWLIDTAHNLNLNSDDISKNAYKCDQYNFFQIRNSIRNIQKELKKNNPKYINHFEILNLIRQFNHYTKILKN